MELYLPMDRLDAEKVIQCRALGMLVQMVVA